MPQLKSKKELSQEAETLAVSFECVHHNGVVYIPADADTWGTDVIPPPERKVWLPLDQTMLQRKAKQQFNTLFHQRSELDSFHFMVSQVAQQELGQATSLLIRTPAGLRELREDGKLHVPTGSFVPNALPVPLNEDPADKAEVMAVLEEWLDSEEEALSLLRHCATALAPHWSAVRYILLIGDGRNGKSILLQMLQRIFGRENCSSITRQDIAEKSPVVAELQGKLLNLVYDGQAVYLKDSGHEKSLVAGEEIGVRLLYRSTQTQVQTNALFIEGLNREPKSSDKSSALQARIVRYEFPNIYEEDLVFKDRMLDDRMCGALLSLLVDHYVQKKDKGVMLAPTSKSLELQREHQLSNSLAMQFIVWLDAQPSDSADDLIGLELSEVASRFRSWRVSVGDIETWDESSVMSMFSPVMTTERRSKRMPGKAAPSKIRVMTGFKKDAAALLEHYRGEKEEADVVED